MKIKLKRTHDTLYLNENRYKKPKEVFKQILELIKKKINLDEKLIIGDYGCANGESCYYYKSKLKNSEITGYDLLKSLINKAKQKVKNVKFVCGSVLDKIISKANNNDISICVGVLSIFESFEVFFDNLILWTKPKGKIYVHTFFNKYPIDVNIKYSHSKNWLYKQPKFLETGYNIFSIRTISKFLKKKKEVKSFKFHEFIMNKNLKKNKKDPLRAWTTKLENKKAFISGLNVIQTFYFIEINLK